MKNLRFSGNLHVFSGVKRKGRHRAKGGKGPPLTGCQLKHLLVSINLKSSRLFYKALSVYKI